MQFSWARYFSQNKYTDTLVIMQYKNMILASLEIQQF